MADGSRHGEKRPQSLAIFEIYADAKAYEQHRQTPHFQAYLSKTAQMVAEKEMLKVKAEVVGGDLVI
ncbi:putative quinol monooxygenase [Avibacterium avium]|uniref:putative quinol monooxygenase n=1 Tax=Avibacterium avium TaxID=751 RepID=UPI003BF79270